MRISYCGGTVSADEVLKYLALTGHAPDLFAEIIKNRELVRKAEELGIEVSDAQLQAFADNFRVAQDLQSKGAMRDYLETFGLTEDDFMEFCELCLKREAVKQRLADDGAVEALFAADPSYYDLARIAVILVDSEDLARDLAAQLRDGRGDFFSLARQHSLCVTTKHAGGRVGLISRGRLKKILTPAIAEQIFDAAPGDVIGPYRERKYFRMILVEELKQAAPSGRMRESIKERIIDEWGAQFLAGGIAVTP